MNQPRTKTGGVLRLEACITHDTFEAARFRDGYPGSGFCLCCGMPWTMVVEHVTGYESTGTDDISGHPRKGIFVLCETCWGILASPESRIEYYGMMLAYWDDIGCSASERERGNIKRAVANGG